MASPWQVSRIEQMMFGHRLTARPQPARARARVCTSATISLLLSLALSSSLPGCVSPDVTSRRRRRFIGLYEDTATLFVLAVLHCICRFRIRKHVSERAISRAHARASSGRVVTTGRVDTCGRRYQTWPPVNSLPLPSSRPLPYSAIRNRPCDTTRRDAT